MTAIVVKLARIQKVHDTVKNEKPIIYLIG